MPELAVVIVSYNTADILRDCLHALYRHAAGGPEMEVIVVDNDSRDGSVAMVREEFPSVRLIAHGRNVGFGAATNIGIEATQAPYLMLLNSDAMMLSNVGDSLVAYLKANPDVVCVGPRVVLRDGTPQPRVFGEQPSLWRLAMQSSGLSRMFPRSFLFRGIDNNHCNSAEMDVGWISGVCMAMRRSDFVAVGGFDPAIFMYCDDIDICSRLIKRGGRVVHLDGPCVMHYLAASSKSAAARLRIAVWQQRNLLKVVRDRSGLMALFCARLILLAGHLPRMAAGLVLGLRQGFDSNTVFLSSWCRVLDLVGLLRKLPD